MLIKGNSDLTGMQICLHTITERPIERIPCCTKPLWKVAILVQNSYEQAKLVDTVLRILAITYWVCWLLVSGDREEGDCVLGGWGRQKLWEAEVFEDLNLT